MWTCRKPTACWRDTRKELGRGHRAAAGGRPHMGKPELARLTKRVLSPVAIHLSACQAAHAAPRAPGGAAGAAKGCVGGLVSRRVWAESVRNCPSLSLLAPIPKCSSAGWRTRRAAWRSRACSLRRCIRHPNPWRSCRQVARDGECRSPSLMASRHADAADGLDSTATCGSPPVCALVGGAHVAGPRPPSSFQDEEEQRILEENYRNAATGESAAE